VSLTCGSHSHVAMRNHSRTATWVPHDVDPVPFPLPRGYHRSHLRSHHVDPTTTTPTPTWPATRPLRPTATWPTGSHHQVASWVPRDVDPAPFPLPRGYYRCHMRSHHVDFTTTISDCHMATWDPSPRGSNVTWTLKFFLYLLKSKNLCRQVSTKLN
jgi:hypothetical protein